MEARPRSSSPQHLPSPTWCGYKYLGLDISTAPWPPPVVVLGVASHVRHGVEAAGASPDAASGPVHHSVVHILLGQRVVIPVVSTQKYLDIALCSTFKLEKEEGRTTYLSSQRL